MFRHPGRRLHADRRGRHPGRLKTQGLCQRVAASICNHASFSKKQILSVFVQSSCLMPILLFHRPNVVRSLQPHPHASHFQKRSVYVWIVRGNYPHRCWGNLGIRARARGSPERADADLVLAWLTIPLLGVSQVLPNGTAKSSRDHEAPHACRLEAGRRRVPIGSCVRKWAVKALIRCSFVHMCVRYG